MSIKTNLLEIKSQLLPSTTLVAVSKFKTKENIMEAYDAGQLDFGENYVQELTQKAEELPKDIRWHFIGSLQRNKVKFIAPFIHLIHSVDSLRLLKEINKQAQSNNRTISCLLQMHIAQEDTKSGMNEEELFDLIHSDEFKQLENIRILGLMGMSTFTDDYEIVRKEFKALAETFKKVKTILPEITELSMGMSGDYPIAIEEGSTIVRVGSAIFGARN